MDEIRPETVPPDGDEVGSLTLFDEADVHEIWGEWQGMPRFEQQDLQPWASVAVNFRNVEDFRAFQQLLGQTIPYPIVRGVWYPPLQITHFMDKRYRDEGEPAADDVPGKSRL